jgi:SulP family sulfate permease
MFKQVAAKFRGYRLADLPSDLTAGIAVAFLGAPQGLAHATIAGLPPAVGLYAAIFPGIVAGLLRSSSHVVVGSTNSLSLLVGVAVAAHASHDPLSTAITLAFMVGIFQVMAGLLRWGPIVDFVSGAVVIGYMTGAGVLIAAGQLHTVTGTHGPGGSLWNNVAGWIAALPDTNPASAGLAALSVALILIARRLSVRWGWPVPGPLVATLVGLLLHRFLSLGAYGVGEVGDLTPIAAALPQFSLPEFGRMRDLLSTAAAATVLSMVEAASVGRAIAQKTKQRIDPSQDLAGQGWANVVAAFASGMPVSGSLARSVLNERAGAKTFVAGIVAAVMTLAVLMALGGVLNAVPLPVLGGVILTVATDLVDFSKIKTVLRSSRADAATFVATTLGAWILTLDQAIYLGVSLSIILLLNQLREPKISELWFDKEGKVHEDATWRKELEDDAARVRILHLQGPLFFAVSPSLASAADAALADPRLKVLILRPQRAGQLDYTAAQLIVSLAEQIRQGGRRMFVVGLTAEGKAMLWRLGGERVLGEDAIFERQEEWLASLRAAYKHAHETLRAQESCSGAPVNAMAMSASAV